MLGAMSDMTQVGLFDNAERYGENRQGYRYNMDHIIRSMDINPLMDTYDGIGAPPYSPKMLT